MKRIVHRGILVCALLALSTRGYAETAKLVITDLITGSFITIQDEGPLDAYHGVVGVILYSGTLGSWVLNVTTGITKPIMGSASQAMMDLNSVNVSTGVAGKLKIDFIETGFGPGGGTFESAIGGVTIGTLTYSTFFDGVSLTSQGALGPGAVSSTTYGYAFSGSSYSLTESVTVIHNTAGLSGFNTSLHQQVQVPEPSFILLLGIGLGAIGLFAWRWRS